MRFNCHVTDEEELEEKFNKLDRRERSEIEEEEEVAWWKTKMEIKKRNENDDVA